MGQEGHRQQRGKEGGLFCAVWSCWTDGINSSQLATSAGLTHRSITFKSMVFLLQLKMWFTSCGDTSYLGQRLSTLLQIPLKKDFNRAQYPVLSCANRLHAIGGSV